LTILANPEKTADTGGFFWILLLFYCPGHPAPFGFCSQRLEPPTVTCTEALVESEV
jgi:hypothetical protein